MKKQKNACFWVAIALILCLISSVGASIVQTGGGAIKYHDITMVTDSGHELDALLLVPKNATRENPARCQPWLVQQPRDAGPQLC